MDEVLLSEAYVVNGETFDPYLPYAGYTPEGGNDVSLQPGQSLGNSCKAYTVRNAEVFFGCARSSAANAESDMDESSVIWGPGRTEYTNVGADGQPVPWVKQ